MAAASHPTPPRVKVTKPNAPVAAVAGSYTPPAVPRVPKEHIPNIPALLTFVVASTGACIGMMSSTNFEQPIAVAVPFLAIYLVAYFVPRAPAWLSCSIFPIVTVYSALFVENAQIAVALVSQAGVAAVRTCAMVYYPELQGNYGGRVCALQMICIFEGAVPRTETVMELVKRWVPNMALHGGLAFGLHRSAIFLIGREALKESIFVSGAIMGLIAMLVLQVLDGVYDLCFAYPARVSFSQPIQRAPLLSLSLREFWNSRWDVSVANALRRGIYDPVIGAFGFSKTVATAAAFFASALIHLLQFVAWRAPYWAIASVFAFFVLQAGLLEVEKALHVLSWKSAPLRRLWTFGVLALCSPLITIPLIIVNRTWDEV